MKLGSFNILSLVLLAAPAGCADDDPPGPVGGSDARDVAPDITPDITRDTTPDLAPEVTVADAAIELPDAAVSDTSSPDVRPSVDCSARLYPETLIIHVPGYLARFGEDGRNIEARLCLDSNCGTVRVESLGPNGRVTSQSGEHIQLSLAPDGRLTVLYSGAVRPMAGVQHQVSLRITPSSGAWVADYLGRGALGPYCPGGLGCGMQQAIILDVDLNRGDGGAPIDGPGGMCNP